MSILNYCVECGTTEELCKRCWFCADHCTCDVPSLDNPVFDEVDEMGCVAKALEIGKNVVLL